MSEFPKIKFPKIDLVCTITARFTVQNNKETEAVQTTIEEALDRLREVGEAYITYEQKEMR